MFRSFLWISAVVVLLLGSAFSQERTVKKEPTKKEFQFVGVGKCYNCHKIPKSGNLKQYMEEPDAAKRRKLYCHCPRVLEVIRTGGTLPPLYCYCGAGFYRDLWEEILQQPVEVEVLRSILMGDDVCSFILRLPAEDDSAAGP